MEPATAGDFPGAKLVRGIHRDAYGVWMITVELPDGIRQEVRYYDVLASPLHVQAMLEANGIGEDDPEIREATRQYCIDEIKRCNETLATRMFTMTLNDLETYAIGFADGYRAARRKYEKQ